MKAAVYEKYGGPEVVQIKDIPVPTPNENEVLVRIRNTTVNRTDCGFRASKPAFARVFYGLFKPRYPVLGTEFSGDVVAIGSAVEKFKEGDRVFGLHEGFGAHAEFMCMNEDLPIALIPENVSYEVAGSVLEGMYLSESYLKRPDYTNIKNILINGATGSIGSAGLQFSRNRNLEITAVCRAKDFDLIRSLGASHLIDYNTQDFTKVVQDKFDIIFDAVGKSSFFKCKPLMKEKSVFYATEFGPYASNGWLPLFNKFRGGKKIYFPLPKINQEDVIKYGKLLAEGKYTPLIDKRYSLEDISEAYRYADSEQKVGNLVIEIL